MGGGTICCNLLCKNLRTDLRAWKKFLAEVIVIIILSSLIAQNSMNPQHHRMNKITDTYFSEKLENPVSLRSFDETWKEDGRALNNYYLAYAPANSLVGKSIANKVNDAMNLKGVVAFNDSYQMELNFKEDSMMAGLNFLNDPNIAIPKHLNVEIRFPPKLRFREKDALNEDAMWRTKCCSIKSRQDRNSPKYLEQDIYYNEGFLALQDEIFRAWIKSFNSENNDKFKANMSDVNYDLNLRSFRYNDVCEYCYESTILYLYNFFISFMFFLPFCNIVWKIGREVQENVMAHHWSYGCYITYHWFMHAVASMLHLIFLDLVFIAMIKIPWKKGANESIFVIPLIELIAFLLVYNLALIITAICFAVCVRNAGTAVLFAIVAWILNFSLFFSTLIYDRYISHFYIYLAITIFFNNAFDFSFHLLKFNDDYWQDVSIWTLCACLAGNMILYILFTFIVFAIFPFKYMGRSILSCAVKKKLKNDNSLFPRFFFNITAEHVKNFQFGRPSGEVLLSCKHIATLKRKYREQRMHLRNISLSFYQDEITVILGPNRSGKTSLMCLFAGLCHPDYGYVYYRKKSLLRYWGTVKHNSDFLMPNNPLFDLLTVEETLKYFIKIKGDQIDGKEKSDELRKWLKALKPVVGNVETYVKNLTYEQKRFVSLCAAFACGTKIILLDEPTIYMKTKEQFYLWRLLKENKQGRTIVIATNNNDEAEQVGDRMVILNHGRVKAFGSVFFLKQLFRTHYQLVIVKQPNAVSGNITTFLKSLDLDIELHLELGDQLLYKIPISKKDKFQKVLVFLEKESKSLGVSKFHLLDFSFSEIVTHLDFFHNSTQASDLSGYAKGLFFPFVLISKCQQIKQQFRALFHIRYFEENYFPYAIGFLTLGFILVMAMNDSFATFGKSGSSKAFRIYYDMDKGINDFEPMSSNSLAQNCSYYKLSKNNVIECGKENFSDAFRKGYDVFKLGAIQIKDNEKMIMLNQKMVHTAPIALNVLHNIMLKRTFRDDDLTIKVTNNPFVGRASTTDKSKTIRIYILPIVVGTIWPLLSALFSLFFVHNRIYNMDILQELAGVNTSVKWFTNFCWDFCTHTVYVLVLLIYLVFTRIEDLDTAAKATAVLLLFFYGIPNIWSVYLVAIFVRHSKSRSFAYCSLIGLLAGIMVFLFFWEVLEKKKWHFIFEILPQFTVLYGLAIIHINSQQKADCYVKGKVKCEKPNDCTLEEICATFRNCCRDKYSEIYEWGTGHSLTHCFVYFLGSTAVIIFIFTLVLMSRRDRKHRLPGKVKNYRSYFYDDDDANVISLRKYIANLSLNQCKRIRVCVDQVEKNLPKNTIKIATLSFNVDKSNCLCIFGGHKTDKTHFAKQLVGEIGFHFGEIYMRGLDFKRELPNVRKMLGYCPQDFGYWNYLTVAQAFHMFYMLRGVSEDAIADRIVLISALLQLTPFLNRHPHELTLTQLRKVKLGIAIISQNKILVLDEPTGGLSGEGKIEIWNIIRFLCANGRAIIVLTSDNIECKYLANYVLVAENYEMLAYGNLYSIIQKNSPGFIVKVRFRLEGDNSNETYQNLANQYENLQRLMTFFHDDAKEIARHDNEVIYFCPVKRLNFSYLYGVLERHKTRLQIADYTIEYCPIGDILNSLSRQRAQLKQKRSKKRKRNP